MKRIFLQSILEWNGKGVISIIGPTGTGKTRLAIDWISKNYSNNKKAPLLVSVDSVAAFERLDIGSAKPTKELQESHRFAGLNLFRLDQTATASDFVTRVAPEIKQALDNELPVILVGGSHFYERALVEGRGPGAASDPNFQVELSKSPESELFKRLVAIDPRFGEKIHPNDRYRLCRFLDLAERQRLSFDALFNSENAPLHPAWTQTPTLLCGIEIEVEKLKDILLARINEMFGEGWIEEVENILNNQISPECPGLQSVGYFEIVECLKGRISKDELKPLILTRHLQLAKKQRTWLRGMLR